MIIDPSLIPSIFAAISKICGRSTWNPDEARLQTLFNTGITFQDSGSNRLYQTRVHKLPQCQTGRTDRKTEIRTDRQSQPYSLGLTGITNIWGICMQCIVIAAQVKLTFSFDFYYLFQLFCYFLYRFWNSSRLFIYYLRICRWINRLNGTPHFKVDRQYNDWYNYKYILRLLLCKILSNPYKYQFM